jgi:iron complex outermembrane receptor protein
VAPIETTNANRALDPSRSRQIEFGIKGALDNDTSVSLALFRIRKGLEYTQLNANATSTFVRNGEATHTGLELGAQGRAMPGLGYSVSLMALNTKQEGTGMADMDGRRVTNVPNFKSTSMLEYTVPGADGVKISGVWQYAGSKAFDVENKTIVPAYHTFDLMASYAMRLGGAATTVRAGVYNVTDKFYWRDVTPALGGYLLPGAPRTFKLSAQFDF